MLLQSSAEAETRTLTTIGIAVVLCCLAVAGFFVVNPFAGRATGRISLAIDTPYVVQGVTGGTPVVSHGIEIGKVTAVSSLSGGRVRLDVGLQKLPVAQLTDAMQIDFRPVNSFDDRFHVPVDSNVRLENLSALGESYIGLVPQSEGGPMLHDGQRIATQRVIQPPSISELAVSVSRLLSQAGPEALKRIVGEVDTALPDPISTLPNLSRTSKLLRNVAADMHGRGRILLDNFQTLLQNAGWVGPLIADVTPGFRQIGLDLGKSLGSALVGKSLGAPQILVQFNHFLDRIQKLLDDNGGDLRVLGEAFLPHLKGIAGALMNFDTGQMLSHVLESVPADGAITLHVAIPPK